MRASSPLHAALQTFRASVRLYVRHFVLLTAISLLPALGRIAFFLTAQHAAAAVVGTLEAVVGFVRVVLFFVIFRLVFPHGWPESAFLPPQRPPERPLQRLAARWPELAWHVVLVLGVFFALNAAAAAVGTALGGAAVLEAPGSDVPARQDAVTFAVKNLVVIPFWLVHMLVTIRDVMSAPPAHGKKGDHAEDAK